MLQLRLPLPTFRSAKNVVLGPDSIMALRSLESSKVAVICSYGFSQQSQLFENLIKNIRAHDIEIIKKSWTSDPTLSDLSAPLKALEQFGADTIVAVGGGAVIDAAKLIWMFYEHPDISPTSYLRPNAIPNLRGRARFIAIPTTTGSGSEVSSSALLYNPETGRKEAVVTHDFLPDLVILDPKLLVGLPNDVLISTTCDALSHSIEGYVSRLKNPLMDILAEKAVQTIFFNWKEATGSRNLEAIGQMQYAAMMAGWVQNHCLVGGAHALAHQLAAFDVPHGNANAILLPAVIRRNATDKETASKYRSLCQVCGLGKDHEALAAQIEVIRDAAKFPNKLSEYGVGNVEAIVEGTLSDPAARSNPIEVDEAYVLEVAKKCL